MPNVAFGGANTTTGYKSNGSIYTPIAIGARRLAANGQGPQYITQLWGYLGGRGGACSGNISLGSSTAAVSIPSASNGGTLRGPFNTSDWYIANGTTANYSFATTGGTNSFYFGRSTTGVTYDAQDVPNPWTGVAGGTYTYVQCPSAPGNLTLTSTIMGQVTATWNEAGTGTPVVPGDNGGSTVNGYRLQYSLVETFGSGVTTIDIVGNTPTSTITGLTPGATYFFRVASKNVVTTPANTSSVYSSTKSVFVMVDAAMAYALLNPSRNAVTPLQDGAFWSLTGHGAGFDRNAGLIKPSVTPFTYNYYDAQSASYKTQQGEIPYNLVRVNSSTTDIPPSYVGPQLDPFIVYPTGSAGDTIYANNIQYSCFSVRRVNATYNSVYRMAYKTRLWYPDPVDWATVKDYWSHSVNWQGLPQDSFLFTGQQYNYTIDPSTQTLTITVNYINTSGTPAVATSNVSFSGLTMTNADEINVYVEYTYNAAYQHKLRVAMCPSSNVADYVSTVVTYTTNRPDVYNSPVVISGVARSLYVTHTEHQGTIAPYEWESDKGYVTNSLTSVTTIPDIGGPTLGVKMNGWEYLQAAAAASNMELSLENNKINVRYTGSKVVDISNIVPSISTTPTTTFSGRQVDVQYNNAITVALPDATSTEIPESRPEEMYNAYLDSNQSFEVKAGEILKKTVNTNNYPISVYNPTRIASVTDPVTGKIKFSDALALYGQYAVSDSTGLLLGSDKFEAGGGSVEVAINADIPNAIDITFTGPRLEIPSYTGPYKLAISDGQTEWAALSIRGYGLKTDPKTVSLLTGSAESKTPQKTAKTINNPFIDSVARAYNQGAWAATDAAGPKVVISGSIPTDDLGANGLGVSAGALIRYNNSVYRITELSIGNIETKFQASRYVTVGEFDSKWMRGVDNITVAYHDSIWAGKEVQDETVLPLYGSTKNQAYVKYDTDGKLYFDILAEAGDIAIMFDTDGVPYSVDSTSVIPANLVYLDTDFNPYY